MLEMKSKVKLVGPVVGRKNVVKALKDVGMEVVDRGAGVVMTGLRDGDWRDVMLIQHLVKRYMQVWVVALDKEVVPRGEIPGKKWVRLKLRWGLRGWKLMPREKEKEGPGDWTLPKLTYNKKTKKVEGWRMQTFLKIREMKELPEEMLQKIKVGFMPGEPWYEQRLARYFPLKLTGDGEGVPVVTGVTEEGYETCYLTGKQLVEACPDSESFLVEVHGWPLKWVPLTYLRWLVGDGHFWKQERVPGCKELKLLHRIFQPCEGILRKKIVEYLDMLENREVFEPFKDEVETREFYGTGCWVRGEVPVDFVRWQEELGGEKVWRTSQAVIQKFADLGVSKKDKWGWTGLRKPLVREHNWDEEEDPAPGDWQLGLTSKFPGEGVWTDHSRWVMEEVKERKKPWSWREVWNRMLRAQSWIEGQVRRWQREALRKRGLNKCEQEELQQEFEDCRMKLGDVMQQLIEEWEPQLQDEKQSQDAQEGALALHQALKGWQEGLEPEFPDSWPVEAKELQERVEWEARHPEVESYQRPGGNRKGLEWALKMSLRAARGQVEGSGPEKVYQPVVLNGFVELVPVLVGG